MSGIFRRVGLAIRRTFQMHNIGAQSFRLAIALMIVGMSTSSAHAYLDPGTGSIILQLLLGGVAGVALAGKLYWHKFLSLLGVRRQVKKGKRLSGKRSVDADERGRQ
jgi:hypothetical protein